MGEAKNKQRPLLTEEQRMQALADVSIETVYDDMYSMCASIYTQLGGAAHQLLALDFENGKSKSVHSLEVRRKEDVNHLLSDMLARWPMVVHIFEAWAAPDANASAPSAHPLRQDVVCIMLHTNDVVAAAHCPANEEAKTLEKSPLVYPDRVEGLMRTFEAPRARH